MNDFLTNLMARSRGDLPTIRPRLLSLYEPNRRGTTFNPVRNGTSEFEQGAWGAGLKPVPSVFHSGRSEPSAAESSEESRDASQTSPSLTGSLLPHRGTRWAWNALSPNRADASSNDKWSSLDSSPAPIIDQKSSDGAFEPKARENGFTETRAKAEPSDQKLHRSQDLTIPARADSSFDLSSRLDSGNIKSAGPIRASTLRPQPAARAFRSARSEADWIQSRAQRSTPHESPINITIGRVEVRAILPAPPARRAVPTKPWTTLSLDDYLKQRNKGRR